MSDYSIRTKAPAGNNKYYLHTSAGGYNSCIHIANGSCLPNCVGYSWGRWYELLGTEPKLSRRNAENWYGYTSDGYKRSKTPNRFAVVCWRKGEANNGNDGAGHVAIVEEVKSNGDIVCSESHYGGTRWRQKTYTKSSNYYMGSAYTFQGFILFPVDVDKQELTTGDYEVTDCSLLNVRTGAGTTYTKKNYSEFTTNAQKQIYDIVKYKANGYVRGVKFTVSEVKNNWGKTPSGWVCLDYCTKL